MAEMFLCTVFIFVIFYVLNDVKAADLTYIIKKDKGLIEPSCIAEELDRYAAIGWIYPIPENEEELPNITSKYIPTYENEYNCKFIKNTLCNARWSIRDWNTDGSSIKTRDVIMDRRWEDYPSILISNKSKEFKHKVEVDKIVSFSVRANGLVEIFICSGWNPYNYPCYYFKFDYKEVFFKYYQVVPKVMNDDDVKTSVEEYYKIFTNILTHEEWRTFQIEWNATQITLNDVNMNRTIITHTFRENEKISPVYMFMRSSNASLWKIHQDQFFYTNSTQISRLGPQLTLNNKDLCVSLLISSCSNCETIFFYQKYPAPKKILKQVGPTNEHWIEIKIKEENADYEKVNLFVQTKLLNESLNTSGFWAIDDVRVCHENEVKVTFLKLNKTKEIDQENVSCQLIKKPSWQPNKLVYHGIKEFPKISSISNSTSITLRWAEEDPDHHISYFITYEANDICITEPISSSRIKSNGFLSTKVNEITINNLVPYTLYNISVASVLHEAVRRKQINTLETFEPTYEERPLNVQIRALDTKVNVTWEKVSCKDRYGRIVYTLIVKNPQTNFTKTVALQTDNTYEIGGLTPFTDYNLEIIAGRNGRNVHNRINVSSIFFNFSTSPGVAPPVENLELYAIDTNSASLRFELPKDPHGEINEVQIRKCNSLSFNKCKSLITPLRPCSLWSGKYCNDINDLTPNMKYTFRISLHNRNTNTFGQEIRVQGVTNEKVPGQPGNITYRIVDCYTATDYCNLNLTWLHPYYPNGSITEFDIILNATDKQGLSEENTAIHEIYKVENKTYYPHYTYQIKYIPYSSHYNVYIRSGNKMYKSDFTQIHIKTDNVGDHIDQHPKLIGKSHATLIFKLPHLDRRLDHYNITVVVQDFNNSIKIDDALMRDDKIGNNLCHDYGTTWVALKLQITSNATENITIGNSEKQSFQPLTKYCLTFIISNKYKDTEHDVVYYEKLRTDDIPPASKEASSYSQSHLYLLLIFLILIPIGFLVYRYMRKRRMIPKSTENNENVYETLPFDECETNGVSNENYDQLVHK